MLQYGVRRNDVMEGFSLFNQRHPAVSGPAPHPGLLLLHGRGADETDLLPLAAELDPRLFTVTARAPYRFPYGGYMWYPLDEQGVGFPDPAVLIQSLDLLVRFIGEIVAAYPIDPRRLYVGGFSMGAAMAAGLTLTQPELVAGAFVLSGYLPLHAGLTFRSEEAAGRPIFQAHGTLDEIIPIAWARETRDFLETTPADLTYREYPIGHQISYPELQDVSAWLTGVLDGRQHAADPALE